MTQMMKRLCEAAVEASFDDVAEHIEKERIEVIVRAVLKEMLEMDADQIDAIDKITPSLGAAAYRAGIETILGES